MAEILAFLTVAWLFRDEPGAPCKAAQQTYAADDDDDWIYAALAAEDAGLLDAELFKD